MAIRSIRNKGVTSDEMVRTMRNAWIGGYVEKVEDVKKGKT